MITPTTNTKDWIKDFIIKHNFCPFAAKVYVNDQIHYLETSYTTDENLLKDFGHCIQSMTHSNSDTIYTTSILIVTSGLHDFTHYLDIFHLLEDGLEHVGLSEDYQLASFHPDYRFSGTQADDITNLTNRSPYPLIHILRTEDVLDARSTYPDIGLIPERNMDMIRTLHRDNLI